MNLLYLLEGIRVPVLDQLMLAVTRLGEETAFLVIALIVFWCVDKRKGYFLLSVGFIGTIGNQLLKLACRIPRPWMLDSEFTIVEQAREAATGYSFPSGHTQTAVGTFGSLAYTEKKKGLKILWIVLMTLVAFSRMYLGVHTPADVLVGAAMALVLIIGLQPVVYGENPRGMKIMLASMIGLSLVFLLYVELWQFPADMDAHNLQSGYKNAYTMLGCTIGAALVYVADTKKLNFPVKAVWWAQIIKVIVGLALVLAVKEGLRAPFEWIFGGHMMARGVRYLLIVLVAGILWPMTFSWLEKLGKK
ncbi:MAG: phosphatase PAP2 family protein [Oscillospiraceae bacterium]|nr:phosphatase PAP2 family protein [Oscillospiraceae bacterium]